MNEGFGKDFYRKGNSVKRLRPIHCTAGLCELKTLRAKGTLISEPRFKGKTAFSKKNPRQRPFPLSRVGKSHLAGGRKSGLTNQCAFGPQGSCCPHPLAKNQLLMSPRTGP